MRARTAKREKSVGYTANFDTDKGIRKMRIFDHIGLLRQKDPLPRSWATEAKLVDNCNIFRLILSFVTNSN